MGNRLFERTLARAAKQMKYICAVRDKLEDEYIKQCQSIIYAANRLSASLGGTPMKYTCDKCGIKHVFDNDPSAQKIALRWQWRLGDNGLVHLCPRCAEGAAMEPKTETIAKVVETTPEKWLEGYRRWSASDDLALAQDDAGVYYFTTKDGVYNEAPGVKVPNHILNQPWSVAVEEFENGAMEMEGTYYKIDDTGYLYEAPWGY